jgi:hypothetical protein
LAGGGRFLISASGVPERLMMMRSGLLLLLASNAISFHINSYRNSDRYLSRQQYHLEGIQLRYHTGLPSVLKVDESMSVLEGPDDDLEINLIDGMGQEMMQLVIEAAALKSTPIKFADELNLNVVTSEVPK